MAYLVTGATGFVGSYLVKELLHDGEKEVIAFDILPAGNALDVVLTPEEKAKVKIIKGDILDLAQLLRTMKDNNVTSVFHLAALLPPACIANPKLGVRVNCEGTANIFEAARILNLTKVIWTSTASVFGAQSLYPEGDIPNDAPHTPLTLYSACKSLNEHLAATYFEHYEVDSSAIRPTVVYGIGRREGLAARLVDELMIKPVLGQPAQVPYGNSLIDWLYVEDAVGALIATSKVTKAPTRVYSTSGEVRTVREASECAKEISPGAEITLLEDGDLPLAIRFDTTPLEQETGFRSKWTLKDGMTDIANKIRLGYNV